MKTETNVQLAKALHHNVLLFKKPKNNALSPVCMHNMQKVSQRALCYSAYTLARCQFKINTNT